MQVDVDALPRAVVDRLKSGKVDLDDPANTLALLKTVDDSFARVIGHLSDDEKAALVEYLRSM